MFHATAKKKKRHAAALLKDLVFSPRKVPTSFSPLYYTYVKKMVNNNSCFFRFTLMKALVRANKLVEKSDKELIKNLSSIIHVDRIESNLSELLITVFSK